jgi:hypothetical protein
MHVRIEKGRGLVSAIPDAIHILTEDGAQHNYRTPVFPIGGDKPSWTAAF